MNKRDRVELAKAAEFLGQAQSILESLATAEREKYDNMPESLQQSERGEAMNESAETLDEALFLTEEAIQKLECLE